MYDIRKRRGYFVVRRFGLVFSTHRTYRQARTAMAEAARLDRIEEGLVWVERYRYDQTAAH